MGAYKATYYCSIIVAIKRSYLDSNCSAKQCTLWRAHFETLDTAFKTA